MTALVELGGALRPFDRLPRLDQASRISLAAQETGDLGPLTTQANLQFGLGARNLLPHKRFVLGGRSLETQWRTDAYRQVSAAFERPVEDAHFVGFGPAGPVAYLHSGRLGLTGENVVAGRLSLGDVPFESVSVLAPFRLELFSGLGTVWSDGAFLAGFDADALVGDAGFGARYDVSAIPYLDRWTAQSDVLKDLNLVAKFPIWASNPGLIDPGQDEFAFRWLIGIQL